MPFVRRIKHQLRLLVGAWVGKILLQGSFFGKKVQSRVISAFSDEAKSAGVVTQILVAPTPIRKLRPEFRLPGEIEHEQTQLLLRGEDFTTPAGVFTARTVDVSMPTTMHMTKKRLLGEAMPAPYIWMNPKYLYGLESIRFKHKSRIDEAILLGMPWHHNYYHWMIEILPRLILYDRDPGLHHLTLVVPSSAPRFVAESLNLSGYLSKVRFLKDGVYRFNTLHMLSMLAPATQVSPDAIEWLNKKFPNPISTSLLPKKRIYVSRSDANIRFVSNESALSGILSEFGFEIVVMSDFSLADQIRLFNSAECIIGPHGAAFANLAFAKPGSIFIEFFSKGHDCFSYNRISAIRSLRYGFLIGEPSGGGGFTVRPDQLRTILAQAIP